MADVIVLGAGMVGVSTALALQARGDHVLLVDRAGVGRETSYGNAGVIQSEAVEPYAFPRDLPTLWAVARRAQPGVFWSARGVADKAGALAAYWWHSGPARHARASAAWSQLIARARPAHAALIAGAGAEALIERGGYREVFRTRRAFDAALTLAARIERDYGVAFTAETGDALAVAEPGLQRRLAGAVGFPDPWTCRDPGGLTAAYGRLFVARGGEIAAGDAQSLRAGAGGWTVTVEAGPVSAPRAVVALGPWSGALTRRLGYRIPLFAKRGYHRHYAVENGPRRSLMDAEAGVFVARMDQGLRLCTGVSFAAAGAAADPAPIRRAETTTAELFRLGPPVEPTAWTGERPCLPDMLPVLGEAPRHPGLWLHFGHGHQGFTAGPASAALLAAAMHGEAEPLMAAFSPSRFRGRG